MNKLSVETIIKSPIENVWQVWNNPTDIEKWYNASPDWHTPKALNNLTVGGSFDYRMEAKDGSFGFNFIGVYDVIKEYKLIEITLGDNRKMSVHFSTENNQTKVIELFEPESENPHELQQQGWQAILDNFKKYILGIND